MGRSQEKNLMQLVKYSNNNNNNNRNRKVSHATRRTSGAAFVLHAALMRNLGVAFAEILSLDELAADCANDGQYDFLYAAAPLKVAQATGAPVNPLAIK